jgi:hypothetical protein
MILIIYIAFIDEGQISESLVKVSRLGADKLKKQQP